MSNKKAIISGISGQDGAYLARFLLGKGYHVIGTSRDVATSSFRNLDVLGLKDQLQLETLDLGDLHGLGRLLKKHRPDEIYNLAGQSSVGLSFDQPFETFKSISVAVMNILEAIRVHDQPIRLFSAGSSECFGETNGKPACEKTPFNPLSPYAVAKAAAFWQVANYREAYPVFACTALLYNHESPLRPSRFVTRKIVKSACQIASKGSGVLRLGNLAVKRDWGWAPEYVEAMWAMLQQEKAADYVLATGQTHSLQEFVAAVFSHLGLDWQNHVEFNPALKRPTDIECAMADPAKAERELGWKASYLLDDVARMMVDAEKENQLNY